MTDDVFPSKAGKNKYVVLLQGELLLTKAELNFLHKKRRQARFNSDISETNLERRLNNSMTTIYRV